MSRVVCRSRAVAAHAPQMSSQCCVALCGAVGPSAAAAAAGAVDDAAGPSTTAGRPAWAATLLKGVITSLTFEGFVGSRVWGFRCCCVQLAAGGA